MCVFLPTWFKYKSSMLFKDFTECASAMPFGKLFQELAILLRKKCVLGSYPLVHLSEN